MNFSISGRVVARVAIAALFWTRSAGVDLAGATPSDRPAVIDAIQRRMGDFFLFATTDQTVFDIYQEVQDGQGLPVDPEVVCMFHDCFFKIATTTATGLATAGPGVLEDFRAVQESYRTLRRTLPDEKARAAIAWRETLRHLKCAVTRDDC